MTRSARACLWACAAVWALAGCDDPYVGELVEAPAFDGDLDSGSEVIPPIDSGDSSCSLLSADSCAADEACVRGADGVRFCVPTQGLPSGSPCSIARYDECASGTLCTASDAGAWCLALCVVEATNACAPDATCRFVFTSEGARMGVCEGIAQLP